MGKKIGRGGDVMEEMGKGNGKKETGNGKEGMGRKKWENGNGKEEMGKRKWEGRRKWKRRNGKEEMESHTAITDAQMEPVFLVVTSLFGEDATLASQSRLPLNNSVDELKLGSPQQTDFISVLDILNLSIFAYFNM